MAGGVRTRTSRKLRLIDLLRALRQPHVRVMLMLGFSSGLPFLLSFGTLSAWLATAHVDIKTIGMMSLVNIAYSFKFLWAPLADNVPLPALNRLLGRRRGWMLLAQAGIVVSLLGLSRGDPAADLGAMVPFAVLLAFASSVQDIAIDAWRIEVAPTEQQPLMSGITTLGYRLGLLTSGAGALFLSTRPDWHTAYLVMAASMSVGLLGALLARRTAEPSGPVIGDETVDALAARTGLGRGGQRVIEFLYRAMVAPFIDFFARYGIVVAVLILLTIGCYSIAERVLGVMANPFYIASGFTTDEIAVVSKTYGIWIGIAGAVLGGAAATVVGPRWTLLLGAVLGSAAHLSFAWLATQGHDISAFIIAITFENMLGGFAGTALVAFMSSLTNIKFSGTQYALFTSFAAMPGKFAGAYSGDLVANLGGFYPFFLATAAMGMPAIVLAVIVPRLMTRMVQVPALAPTSV